MTEGQSDQWVAPMARRLWRSFEPIHAVTYFAPECHQRYRDIGLKGFWMGYFASRGAPFGEASPELVAATFFNFHPDMVRRALPDAWAYASPQAALDARLAGSVAALERLVPDLDPAVVDEAVELMQGAVERCSLGGRPLHAALRAVEPPSDGVGRLWHLAGVLREHRGDGHIAACLAGGLDGLGAHVTFAAGGAVPRELLQPFRGWSDEDWSDAEARLRERGWLDADGRATEAGRAGRQGVEDLTDELAAEPWAVLGRTAAERLHELLRPIARSIVAAEGIPSVNTMGVPTADA
jgi:hypothetical protein